MFNHLQLQSAGNHEFCLFTCADGVLQAVDFVMLGVMLIDVALRVLAFGWSYFKSAWNVFDCIVLVLSMGLGLVVLYMNSVRAHASLRHCVHLARVTLTCAVFVCPGSYFFSTALLLSPTRRLAAPPARPAPHFEPPHHSESLPRCRGAQASKELQDDAAAIEGEQRGSCRCVGLKLLGCWVDTAPLCRRPSGAEPCPEGVCRHTARRSAVYCACSAHRICVAGHHSHAGAS